ncbi:transcription factor, putative [Ricinus communis]|uniref:Transcription factor, putative n=1 Tax=Ricinus communis TaxID=3988 RepID=B9S7A3_RICCO|nr:transcription factor, putative [Ricinus communis]|eukprot:XP_002521872.1 trihelix transcription factor ASR3 [Ricinus communis]
MSEPPPPLQQPPPLPPPPLHLPLLPFSTITTTTTTISSSSNREYRKGNWTIQETLTLITAKKLDDERRSKPSTVASTSKPGELRWKWVENYCWAHGCFRSQNQCNDKWDNLLRDFKKVRDYQARSNDSDSSSFPSYWTMERHQRKFYNLPSNMSLEVFEALNEVVQRRYNTNITTTPQQQHVSAVAPPPVPVTSVREAMPETVVMDAPAVPERSESSATESSDKHDGNTGPKRRKVRNIGASIKRSASILAQTIRNCEEKKHKRHQELLEFEQRRLQLEETRNEVNKQGMTDLVLAVTKLSTAIQSLISNQT